MELWNKPISCICQQCKCNQVCEYYAQTIKPVITVVNDNCYEMSDPFVRQLDEALENFSCDYRE